MNTIAEHKCPPIPDMRHSLSIIKNLRQQGPEYLKQLHDEHGLLFRAKVAHRDLLFINDAKIASFVLRNTGNMFSKSHSNRLVKKFLGQGLLTSSGELWKAQRQLLAPTLRPLALEKMICLIDNLIIKEIASLKSTLHIGDSINIQPVIMALTIRIVTECMLGIDISDQITTIQNIFDTLQKLTLDRTQQIIRLPHFIPTRNNRLFREAKLALDNIIFNIILKAKYDRPESGLLSTLLNAQADLSHNQLGDRQIRDEIVTMILGGYETAANTLTWAHMLLLEKPEQYECLRHEANNYLPDRCTTHSEIQQLAYAKWVFQESMRLYPPVWVLLRQAIRDTYVDEYLVRKNTNMVLSIYAIHHNEQYWQSPYEFNPLRFKHYKADKNNQTFLPFSAGPRQCLGINMAMLEGPLILSRLAQSFRFSRDAPLRSDYQTSITLSPKNGLTLTVAQIY